MADSQLKVGQTKRGHDRDQHANLVTSGDKNSTRLLVITSEI